MEIRLQYVQQQQQQRDHVSLLYTRYTSCKCHYIFITPVVKVFTRGISDDASIISITSESSALQFMMVDSSTLSSCIIIICMGSCHLTHLLFASQLCAYNSLIIVVTYTLKLSRTLRSCSYEWETYGTELWSWYGNYPRHLFNQSQCAKSLLNKSECLDTARSLHGTNHTITTSHSYENDSISCNTAMVHAFYPIFIIIIFIFIMYTIQSLHQMYYIIPYVPWFLCHRLCFPMVLLIPGMH